MNASGLSPHQIVREACDQIVRDAYDCRSVSTAREETYASRTICLRGLGGGGKGGEVPSAATIAVPIGSPADPTQQGGHHMNARQLLELANKVRRIRHDLSSSPVADPDNDHQQHHLSEALHFLFSAQQHLTRAAEAED